MLYNKAAMQNAKIASEVTVASNSEMCESSLYNRHNIASEGTKIVLPESTLHMRDFYDGVMHPSELLRSGLITEAESDAMYEDNTALCDAVDKFAAANNITHIVVYEMFDEDPDVANSYEPSAVYIRK